MHRAFPPITVEDFDLFTRSELDVLVRVADEKPPRFGESGHQCLMEFVEASVATLDAHGEFGLTQLGDDLVQLERERRARDRVRRNSAARARSDALRSVGLTRTSSGTWE